MKYSEELRIVIVTGSRHARLIEPVAKVLTELGPDLVVHGGAKGIDALADRWCKENIVARCIVHADWSKGRSAGPTRNAKMVRMFPTAHGAAFPCIESTGTWDCVRKLKAANQEVTITRIGPGWDEVDATLEKAKNERSDSSS